jgi:hypothetical protein
VRPGADSNLEGEDVAGFGDLEQEVRNSGRKQGILQKKNGTDYLPAETRAPRKRSAVGLCVPNDATFRRGPKRAATAPLARAIR